MAGAGDHTPLDLLAQLASEHWETMQLEEKALGSTSTVAKSSVSEASDEQDDGDSTAQYDQKPFIRRVPPAPRVVRVHRAQSESQVLTRSVARKRSAKAEAEEEVPDLNLPTDEALREEILKQLESGTGDGCEMAHFAGLMVHHLEGKFQLKRYYRKKFKSMARNLYRQFYKSG